MPLYLRSETLWTCLWAVIKLLLERKTSRALKSRIQTWHRFRPILVLEQLLKVVTVLVQFSFRGNEKASFYWNPISHFANIIEVYLKAWINVGIFWQHSEDIFFKSAVGRIVEMPYWRIYAWIHISWRFCCFACLVQLSTHWLLPKKSQKDKKLRILKVKGGW